jgi:hypothetical protein
MKLPNQNMSKQITLVNNNHQAPFYRPLNIGHLDIAKQGHGDIKLDQSRAIFKEWLGVHL